MRLGSGKFLSGKLHVSKINLMFISLLLVKLTYKKEGEQLEKFSF
jgi:hypothetical protein